MRKRIEFKIKSRQALQSLIEKAPNRITVKCQNVKCGRAGAVMWVGRVSNASVQWNYLAG